MKTNLVLTSADKIVIVLLLVLMLAAVRIVVGFFKEKDNHGKEEK